MEPFHYSRADSAAAALALRQGSNAKFLGAGTNLVDLMRERVERPSALIDVTGLSQTISETPQGGLMIGAAATNSALAEHPLVRQRYPGLTRAIMAGASTQIRNMATVGGNILQRTRCRYFYDVAGARCNKRSPGQGCDAIDGFNRYHAVLGASPACIATHPSDMCVALVAFDAIVHIAGPDGERRLALSELHRLPGTTPDVETVLRADDLVTAVELPPLLVAARSDYRKVRDRASYAFALISVAAALQVEDGRVTDVRLAFGGVAAKPWRACKAEQALIGRPATPQEFLAAARAEMADAQGRQGNAFKPQLVQRTVVAALRKLTGDNT